MLTVRQIVRGSPFGHSSSLTVVPGRSANGVTNGVSDVRGGGRGLELYRQGRRPAPGLQHLRVAAC